MPLEITNETLTPSEIVQRTVTGITVLTLEGATAEYVLALQLAGGGTLNNTDLISATLTLFDEETRSVINSRMNQDILGMTNIGDNDVDISTVSQFTWSLTSEDNIFVDPTRTKRLEWHRAIFTIVFDPGSGPDETLIHEVRFPVKRSFSPE